MKVNEKKEKKKKLGTKLTNDAEKKGFSHPLCHPHRVLVARAFSLVLVCSEQERKKSEGKFVKKNS